MARLIIIGNGFDLHYLKGATAYKKFGEWLCNKYNLSLENENDLPFNKTIEAYTGDFYKNAICGFPKEMADRIDDERNRFFAAMLINMIQDLEDETWNAFETDLSQLPWKKYIDKADSFFKSRQLCGSTVSFGTDFITSSVCTIYSLFCDWVSSIDSASLLKKFHMKNTFQSKIKTVENDDTIIIFNYTDTFENLFGLQPADSRVFHIHGISSCMDSIIVGHGVETKSKGSNSEAVLDCIQDAEVVLYKNPEAVIKKEKNKNMWKKIESDFSDAIRNEIWVYGWNGKGADEPYLKKIVQIVDNSKIECVLYLNNYNADAYKKKELWEKNGFSGKILFFTDEPMK